MQASASMARQLSTADGERSERTACEREERKEEKKRKSVVNSAEKSERKKSEKRKLIRKRK